MDNSKKYTEKDLDNFIDEILNAHIECDDMPNVCDVMQTNAGRERIKKRVKYLLLKDGMRNIDSAIGHIETELNINNLNN